MSYKYLMLNNEKEKTPKKITLSTNYYLQHKIMY